MRTSIAGLIFASTLVSSAALAQYAAFNEAGVTMGHWHFTSHDVEANKKIFMAMGGRDVSRGAAATVQFPGARINLNLGNEPPGKGGTVGSVINHVGFVVDNVQERVAQWKAAGVPVLPGNNNRLDQAFVVTPDGVRIEILEDKTQSVPIRHEHVHFFLVAADIPKAVAWYAKTFGGKSGTRNNQPVVDIPGGQLRFAKADAPQERTRGRVLDHIGFDLKDHATFVRKIEAEGIKLDEPVRKNEATGTTITYITDPWGTRIELVQRGQ
ncbi:MAG TPA: VOC family protein [Xanthobacteraceae bacterium]|jgi:catechol 2,3-dioxygenase-like lactoylglutathione lyase family enzyme